MHISNYQLLHHEGDVAIDNDLMVGGSLTVAQHARFKRTVYVEGTLIYRHLRGMDCGLFDTIEALQHVHPSPRRGQWAIVGTTVDQLALYACQTHGLWTMLSDGQSLSEALHYDDLITGPITLDKVPEIQQYIDTLIQTEIEARQAAIVAEQSARESAIAAERAARESAIASERDAWESAIAAERLARQTAIADLMVENGIHELRFVNVWADDGNLPSTFSGYVWHGTACVLYHRSGTLVEAEMPRTDILYIDCENNRLLRWNGQEMVVLASSSSSSDTPINPDNQNTPTLRDTGNPDFDDPLRPEHYLEIDGQLVRENTELQHQVKWGIPFYDWPLRCYNGVVNVPSVAVSQQPLSVQGDSQSPSLTTDAVVFAPAERIVYKMGVSGIEYTTNDVYYNAVTKAFVLKIGTTYYSSWGNSDEWNDRLTGKARTDCVFSDISEDPSAEEATLYNERTFIVHRNTDLTSIDNIPRGTQSWSEDEVVSVYQAKRISYIFDTETQALVDINTLMTDFTAAVNAAATANNGSLRLSRRIYFMGSFINNANAKINISQQEGFLIDGQGGVLFVRRPNDGPGHPQRGISGQHRTEDTILELAAQKKAQCQEDYEAYIAEHPTATDYDPTATLSAINGSSSPTGTFTSTTLINIARSSGTIRNITIAALRDKDNGAPGGHWRMSSSDSRVNGIVFNAETNYANHDITIENISFKGMYEDIKSHSGTNSANTNIRIDGWKSVGGVQNVANGFAWNIRNADIRQNDYVGAGVHIIYGQGKLTGLWVENSRFQGGRYSSVMLTIHELNGSAGNYSHARDMHFSHCEFLGCQLFGGAGYKGWCRFHDCTFTQTHSTIINNSNVEVNANAINMKYTSMWFENCRFNLFRHALANASHSTVKAILDNCSVYTKDVASFADPSSFGGVIYHKDMELPYKSGTTTPLDWGASASSIGTIALFSGVKDDDGVLINKLPDIITNRIKKASPKGNTANRPTDVEVGYCYFDTSLGDGTPPKGKPIWASNIVETTDAQTGEVTRTVTWVDATGARV